MAASWFLFRQGPAPDRSLCLPEASTATASPSRLHRDRASQVFRPLQELLEPRSRSPARTLGQARAAVLSASMDYRPPSAVGALRLSALRPPTASAQVL